MKLKKFGELIGKITKAKILEALLEKDRSVNKIIEQTGLEQTKTSHALAVLLSLGLVNMDKSGKEHIYSVRKEVKEILNKIEGLR